MGEECSSESSQFERPNSAEKAVKLIVQDQDYTGKIKELQAYLDKMPEHNQRSKQLPLDPSGQYNQVAKSLYQLRVYDESWQVKEIVKPGCSPEVLKVALNSMSCLVNFLSRISSTPKLHASL